MVWLGCWSDWVRELRVGSGHSDDWCYHTVDQRRAPTCPSLAFARVDLTSLGGLDDLGLVAVGPGRADRRPRLHGQHRQTSWCLLAHGQYRRPGCRGRAARTRPAMRWEGVRVIGVDEHVWRRAGETGSRHRHRGSGARARTTRPLSCTRYRPGPLRTGSQNMAGGQARLPRGWAPGVVAMDGIGQAPRSAAAEELPGSVPVMDTLHALPS